MPVLAAIRLSGEIPLSRLAQILVEAWAELWSRFGKLLLLFAGLGLIGLFFSRGRLLAWEGVPGQKNAPAAQNGERKG